VNPCTRRREPLSAITGTLSAIDRNRVRDRPESLSAFPGIRNLALNHLDQSVDERHYSAEARMETQVKAAFQAWADHVSVVIGQPAQASNVIQLAAARA